MTPHPVRPGRALSAVSFAVAALCLAFHDGRARSDEPATIVWRDDYGSALEDARTGNRLLWIQFTGPWCPNCTRMERDSFPVPAIVEHSQRSFLPVKLRSDLNEQLVAAFNLTAIPATIIVAPNRDVIGFHQGYLGPEELESLLNDCLARNPLTPARQAGQRDAKPQPSKLNAKDDQPPATPDLALSGYCTVSLVQDRKLVRGQADHSIVHEGRVYRFANVAASERFRQGPAQYLPWKNGTCPVTHVEEGLSKPGEPRWGALYAGQLFVFASDSNRRRFLENPDRYDTDLALDRGDTHKAVSTRPEQGQ
jgi:YHS domain-containing protein